MYLRRPSYELRLTDRLTTLPLVGPQASMSSLRKRDNCVAPSPKKQNVPKLVTHVPKTEVAPGARARLQAVQHAVRHIQTDVCGLANSGLVLAQTE